MERVGEAVAMLARACRLPAGGDSPAPLPASSARDFDTLSRWVDATASSLGVEADPLRPSYAKLEAEIERAGPTLLAVGLHRPDTTAVVLAVVRVNRGRALLLGPDGIRRHVSMNELCASVREGVDERAETRTDRLLHRAGTPGDRHARAREAILREQLGSRLLDAGWRLSLPPSASFALQMQRAGLWRRASEVVILQTAVQGLSLAAWWLVGKGALDGQLESGWLIAWVLLLGTMVPIRALLSWRQGTATLDLATIFKRRLLHGALRLEPDETRHRGSGQLLGCVIEAEAVESLVTNGGLASLFAIVELVMAGAVLATGPGGRASVLLLGVWVAAAAVGLRVFQRRLRAWTGTRLAMTHDLVERMVGHRTRLAQEPRETWHRGEDDHLSGYANRSATLDHLSAWMTTFPRTWLIAGLASIAPAFLSRQGPSALALGVGGVLLGASALGKLVTGASALLGAHVAWTQAGPLFRAGGRVEAPGRPAFSAAATESEPSAVLLDARDVSFGYQEGRGSVLSGLDLRVFANDRLLLQGPSGGGKSTLGAILTGTRTADSGLLLLGGLDRHTLGLGAWRRRVVAAPQFHENYVLSAPLAFNLLMGRGWPPRPGDLEEATAVCEDLGLGPLLERMPAGLMQMVGETGWQLSHGERSRLFIARALLQKAEMLVLDESFAALDPETLERALRCVLARAPTLLVIAHP